MDKLMVFSDFHHSGLYESLILLFEKRLGGTLMRQIGMDWATNGYWAVYDHPSTQKQYLLDGYIPKDGTPPLNGLSRIENSIHIIKNEAHHSEHKAITLEQFKEMKFDIVIASLPQHIKPFQELVKLYQPQAKFIFQMGNMFTEIIGNLHDIPNLLSSTIDIPVPVGCNAVFYHQEFDLSVFHPINTPVKKSIISFINLLPKTNWGSIYYQMKQELPDYDFKSYGILCDDGTITGVDNISNIMNNSMWGWHCKWGGDGYGHILYNWYACGKPVIIKKSDYADKLGGELLEDEVTCIDLDRRTNYESYELVRRYSQRVPYQYLSQQAYQRFKEKVDFEAEEKKIRIFLEKLI